MVTEFSLFDTVQMKKPHACGSNAWTVIRVGADIKIKCISCNRVVMLPRQDFIRMSKKILTKGDSSQ